MNILVTGGAGFIGSHLTLRLLKEGHAVTVWDNLHTGRLKNLTAHRDFDKFQFVEADVREARDYQGDMIINLACPASPVHYQADPVFTWETSVFGVHNLARLAEKIGAVLLHASTSEVYGDPDVHPQSESYWGNVNTIGIRSCYDEGKRAAETLLHDFRTFKNTDTRLFRIFNTYGPQMLPDDGRVVSNFCVQAARGQELTIFGDGKQTRSFCYVEDLVDGIWRLANLPREKVPPVVNLGNPGEFTMLELAELVFKLMGSEPKLKFLPLPQDDPKRRKPNIELAKEVLGWEPVISLQEGLKPTLEYFKNV